MERRKKALICLFLLVSLIFPRVKIVKAEALPNVEVMESTATIADLVMTYYAESGLAVSNTDWINSLYNSLGTNFGTIEDLAEQGLLVLNENTGMWESTAGLATAIENTSAYASLGLNEVFNVSAQEAAELGGGAVAATGGTILANSAAGVASVGTIPLLGGVTAAYWAGIGAGTLVNHLINKYAPQIYGGSPITENFNLVDGMSTAIVNDISWTFPYGLFYLILVDSEQKGRGYIVNLTDYGNYARYLIPNQNYRDVYVSPKEYSNWGLLGTSYSASGNVRFMYGYGGADISSALAYLIGQGKSNFTYSPDLIGSDGNLEGEYDPSDEKYTVPDILPQIDTSTEAGKPLRLQDWLNFANQANTNTGGGQPDLNKDLFDDILDRIKTLIPVVPDPGPNPDPGGQTRPVPTPTPVPDPDYDVPQPEQPEWQSETTQQTEEVPDSIPTGKPWVVEGLQNKFPFCIPWDIKNMLGKFASASRQAPYISWRFNPPFTPIDYTFQIDLADFEDAAAILRTLELIAFIVGLAFATRYLIGAS